MLVLTRKKGESIVIGKDIEIVIIESQGEQVKLGVKAPKKVKVYRKEVFEQIEKENQQAIESIPKDISKLEDFFKKN